MASRACYKPVTHIIFDSDGTVLDTENMYSDVINEIVAPFGKSYTYEMKLRYMGMPALQSARQLVEELQLPLTPVEYLKIFDSVVFGRINNVQLLPGVKDLMLHLHDHRIPMAIATSSVQAAFHTKSQPHRDLFPALHHVVCGDDPELRPGRGKPHPDIFLLAASRFHPAPDPGQCLVFEDSPNGLQAGIAAGMQVVMIPDPRVPSEQRTGATQVLDSMADFEPQLFGLPHYDTCSKFEFG
ncbi:pseudouridine-5'-phosphatase [Drosophila pseudoobscura]|uniref:pseudouridine 5'-phosphatase n=1 Tax=Drosophila pseudoobscura pseudoobscura TaxID=46245 RepID=Q29LF3_DROPS|nr:pseudouridine-5'-phosphatase [Drosophila pseudoobscura]XP_002132892.1 pseudouridine-5'-phosphatase [Drosophila pseudoobscura]